MSKILAKFGNKEILLSMYNLQQHGCHRPQQQYEFPLLWLGLDKQKAEQKLTRPDHDYAMQSEVSELSCFSQKSSNDLSSSVFFTNNKLKYFVQFLTCLHCTQSQNIPAYFLTQTYFWSRNLKDDFLTKIWTLFLLRISNKNLDFPAFIL